MTDQPSDSWRNKIADLESRRSSTKSDLEPISAEVRAAGAGDAAKLAEMAQRRERLTVTLEALEGDLERAQAGLREALRAEEMQRLRKLHAEADALAVKQAEAAADVDEAAQAFAAALAGYFGTAGAHHNACVQINGGIELHVTGSRPLGAGAIRDALWHAGVHQIREGKVGGRPFAESDAALR